MLVLKTTANADRYLDLTEHEAQRLRTVAEQFSKETLLYHCRVLDETFYAMQRAGAAKRMLAEMALIKLCDATLDTSADALLSRLSKLENTVASGSAVQSLPKESNAVTDSKREQPILEGATDGKKPKQEHAAEQPQLRLLRGWNEMAEQAAAGDGAVLGFLKIAKAFVSEDGRVFLKFPNEFAMSMIERAGLRDSIRAVIGRTIQRLLSEEELIFDVLEGTESLSDLDSLEV